MVVSLGMGLVGWFTIRFVIVEGYQPDTIPVLLGLLLLVGGPFLTYLFLIRSRPASIVVGPLLLVTLVVTCIWVRANFDDGLEGLWIPINLWTIGFASIVVDQGLRVFTRRSIGIQNQSFQLPPPTP